MAYVELRCVLTDFNLHIESNVGNGVLSTQREVLFVHVYDRPFTGGDNDILLLDRTIDYGSRTKLHNDLAWA